MVEIWKIINYENLNDYEISTFGNIKNTNTKRILKIQNVINGYSNIRINKKNYSVHRLVAITFLNNPDNKPTVNHIDKNKHNNKLENLEWATYSEQKKHSQNKIVNNYRGIWKIDINTNEKIKKYNTIKEAGLEINGKEDSFKNISSCALGKTKSAYGFKWEYDNKDNIDNEIWKPFKFEKMKYQNYYVSNLGRIKNKERILKPIVDNNGYYNIHSKLIHIIVANNFINNPNNYNIVNHKDGNKLNNSVENLEWVTSQMNAIHAVNNQLRKNIKKVIHIDDNNNPIKTYNSCLEASKELNVNCSSINKCCKGQIKSCGIQKYKFKYLNDNNDNQINNQIINQIYMGKPTKIYIYDKNNILIDTCNSITETSKKYNVNKKTINAHCKNLVKYPNLNYYFKLN
jgi:hypothetical protein